MLQNKWTLKDKDGLQHSGDNKHGHSIHLELSHAFFVCCEICVGFYSVPHHIVGSGHIKKLNFCQNYTAAAANYCFNSGYNEKEGAGWTNSGRCGGAI